MMRDGVHRAVEELRATCFRGKIHPGFNGGFAMQDARVGFKQPDIIVRNGNLWPAFHDGRGVHPLHIEVKCVCTVFDRREKRRTGRAEVDNPCAIENTFFGQFCQLIPQRLSAEHQRDIAFTFAISMTNEPGITMMAAFRMRGKVGINHQDVQPCLCRVIACSRANGAATNND